MQATRISHPGISMRQLIAVFLIIVTCGVAIAVYAWQTITIPIGIKEPIEVLSYPSQLSLYPGQTLWFNVTIYNQAPVTYVVALVFHMGNATYQSEYVIFDSENYTVTPGIQNLTTALYVALNATPASDTLSVEIVRSSYPPPPSTEQITYTSYTWTTAGGKDTKVTLTVENTGSGTLTVANVEVDGVTAVNYSLTLTTGGASGTTLTLAKGASAKIVITQTFTSGVEYNFMVITAKGNQFGPYTLCAP
jgi:hypothetical protein